MTTPKKRSLEERVERLEGEVTQLKNQIGYGAIEVEKPVTEEVLACGCKESDNCDCPENYDPVKPSKPVTEELSQEDNEWMNASLGKPSKPSECISIPRDVAEEFYKNWKYRDRKDSSIWDLFDAIKTALEEKV